MKVPGMEAAMRTLQSFVLFVIGFNLNYAPDSRMSVCRRDFGRHGRCYPGELIAT
jgi:hypothetical protein